MRHVAGEHGIHPGAGGTAAGSSRGAGRRGLAWAMVLAGIVMIVEIAGGVRSNSLALISDAGHMFTDFVALGLALFAVSMACRAASPKVTFGYYRIEILAALGNGVLLTLVAGWLFYEATLRIANPPAVAAPVVLVVSVIGLAANIAGLRILRRASGDNLNIRGAAMHVLSDALSSGAVVVSGTVIALTGWYRIDPILSYLIGVFIIVGAIRLLKESVDVLLEATPAGIDLESLQNEIRAIDGVREVHDLHVWSITSGMPAFSGHVIVQATTLSHSDRVLNEIKEILRSRYGIGHTTIQIESEAYMEIGEIHDAVPG
ncbi:MAG TPA: cation diffusion facilitator family transporter [Candidatus Saccharimonadales bacterium]|nr:cation diffusion facilitator family transporter [Candidatus Saccharimonadales bacterium]